MAVVKALKPRLPEPAEVGVVVPTNVDKQLFEAGFRQGMSSNVLVEFRASFRAGFRAAKLHLRELRRAQGVVDLPRAQKMLVRP